MRVIILGRMHVCILIFDGASMQYIPYLSTVLTFAFTVSVFRRYLHRRAPYLLIWAIGLLLYGIGTLSEAILGLTFSGMVLKLWYLCGAMLTAAWLGQGSLHLLVRRRGNCTDFDRGVGGYQHPGGFPGSAVSAYARCVCIPDQSAGLFPISKYSGPKWFDYLSDDPA